MPAAILAEAAFPGGGLESGATLVDRYAARLGSHARDLGYSVEVDGRGLLEQPAFACWLSQLCSGAGQTGYVPGAPPAAFPTSAAASGWPESLVPLPDRFCEPLFPSPRTAPARKHSPEIVRRELDGAMGLLRAVWPQAADEVSLLVRVLIDGVAPPGHQTSGSSAACPFVVVIEFEAGAWPGFLADALVHECSHLKLRMAGKVEPLVAREGAARYRHPWRPDERPAEAVLVACHAFVAVHRFHMKCARMRRDEEARTECRRLDTEVGQALQELRRAQPSLTALGRSIAQRLYDEYARTSAEVARCGLTGSARP